MRISHFFHKTLILFAAVSGFLLMHACSDEMAGGRSDAPFVEFSFTRSPVKTRAAVGEDGSGSFTEGDKIDLYSRSTSGEKHFLLTMQGGKWKPQIPRSQLGEGDVTLSGYYPAKEPVQATGRDYHHSVAIDQSADESFTFSDLLYGSAGLKSGQSMVQMDFKHAMHRVRVNVAEEAGGELPSDLKVEVLSKRSGTISGTGEAVLDESTESEWITAHPMSEGWAAVLFPQSTESYKSQGWIRLTTGEKSSTFELPSQINGKPFTRFEAGKEVAVNLTIKNQGGEEGTYTLKFDPNGGKGHMESMHLKPGQKIIMPDGEGHFTRDNGKFDGWTNEPSNPFLEWVVGGDFIMPEHDVTAYAVWKLVDDNIGGACEEFKGTTQWLKGIKPPKKEDWQQVITWDVTEGLDGKTVPTKPGCGWYDVSQDIYEMCWAAGASDMLHYWMDRNADYLERYGYDGPCDYNYQTAGSEIFDDFVAHADLNNGGYAQQGFYWFLVGSDMYKGGAYFKDVFDGKVVAENMIPTNGREAVSRKSITQYITRAFKEDMVIGLDMPSIGLLHQYIVWGAQYDNEGYVNGVYYVNPNDFRKHAGTEKGEKIGLLYMDIVYRENGGAYTEASVPGSYIPIIRIEVCGIGRDVWEEYFRTHPGK